MGRAYSGNGNGGWPRGVAAIDCNGSARGDVKERREDTRVTPGVRASDVPSRVGYHNLSSINLLLSVYKLLLFHLNRPTVTYSRLTMSLSARITAKFHVHEILGVQLNFLLLC